MSTGQKCILGLLTILILPLSIAQPGYSAEKSKVSFSLQGLNGLERASLSPEAKDLLTRNGFVVTPGYKNEIYDYIHLIYSLITS